MIMIIDGFTIVSLHFDCVNHLSTLQYNNQRLEQQDRLHLHSDLAILSEASQHQRHRALYLTFCSVDIWTRLQRADSQMMAPPALQLLEGSSSLLRRLEVLDARQTVLAMPFGRHLLLLAAR